MPSVGDIIRLTAVGALQSQVINTVFDYKVLQWDVAVSGLGILGQNWETEFNAAFEPVTTQGLDYDLLVLENLTDGIQYAETPMAFEGDFSGEFLPSFACYYIKLLRSTRITRSGAKRIPGVPEEYSVNGLVSLPAGTQVAIEQFCGQIRTYPDADGAGGTISLQPVIVGRTKNASGVYELDLSKINPVDSAALNPRISTQNSRKFLS